MGQLETETGTAQLWTLLAQLNAAQPTVLAPPSPSEAMAIYSVAVRLVESRLAADPNAAAATDVEITRDVLLGTRRMLRAALSRLEPEPALPRFMVIDGGDLA